MQCKVWRDGELLQLDCREIAIGDAISLQSGDKVPADGILLEGRLLVEQSALNGENSVAAKLPLPPDSAKEKAKPDFLDACSLFCGSVVVQGNGIMRAEKIGSATVYGGLAQELKDNGRDSPLQLKLRHLAKQISRLAYGGGVLIAAAVLLQRMLRAGGWTAYTADISVVLADMVQALILAGTIIIMAVPEGLPLMVALVSSLNMRKMLEDNVLVRKLAGIEAAGSLNLLFTDKTGTLTTGRLEVVKFLTGELQEAAEFAELTPQINKLVQQQSVLNSSAVMSAGRIIGGNLTEAALCRFSGACQAGELPQRLQFLPFDSRTKYSWALVAAQGDEYCLIKGAPEKLLARSKFYWDAQGRQQELTAAMRQSLELRMQELAKQSMRLLALCRCKGSYTDAEEQNLTLTGIAALRDKVRPAAARAVAAVQNAGVQVVMLTGDSRETAAAIAAEAGLLRGTDEIIYTSDELALLSDEEVKQLLPRLRVLARSLPLDKLRLVRIA